MNQHSNGYGFVLLLLGLILAPLASAGVVSQTNFVKAGLLNQAVPKQQRSHLEVLLDLSGYRDAAVSFDFAALVRLNTTGFKVGSAPSMDFRDGFRLVSPITSRATPGQNRSNLRQNEGGFISRDTLGRRYSTAMFNLAAYDGQTVLLTLDFDGLVAQQRGVINIGRLLVTAAPAGAAPEASIVIPEPTTLLLALAAVLAFMLLPANVNRPPAAPLAARLLGTVPWCGSLRQRLVRV